MRTWVVIPAAGSGQRFGARTPKQYLELEGRPLLGHVLDVFFRASSIDGLVLATALGDERWRALLPDSPPYPVLNAPGGATRAESVLSALDELAERAAPDDWVLVHDAARPCLSGGDLARLIETLQTDPVGGLLAAPVVDTLKEGDASGRVKATRGRDNLWRALTPQMFRFRLLRGALKGALAAGVAVTDEASAVEWAGHRPRLVSGGVDNLKVTRPHDLPLAAAILRARVIKS